MVFGRIIGVLFLALLVGSCDCAGGSLSETCPPPSQLDETCMVHDDGSWTKVTEAQIGWEVDAPSVCRLGHTRCDITTKEIYCEGYVPQGTELCNDLDDDCDGVVDEGINFGWSEPENDCDINTGECSYADKVCILGSYRCVAINAPVQEVCDGLDNNCDGIIDNLDPIQCWDGPDDSIVDGSTPCRTGWSLCTDGEWGFCFGSIIPSEEVCDEVDNNCNGVIDNDAVTNGTPCGPLTNEGQCFQGSETCTSNGESICVGAVFADNEACDAVDNDCDGVVDEELWQPCSTICGLGIEECSQGGWVNCSAQQPELEICDGFDNDCDGFVDENCPCVHGDAQLCNSNIVDSDGVLLDPQCGAGVQVCQFGLWQECEFWGTVPEECNNWDDDCDGVIDDYDVVCGDEETDGIGPCLSGVDQCTFGTWTGCQGAVFPEEEICDLIDNDCDGEVDEGIDPDPRVDMIFVIDISGSMLPYIDALKGGISSYVAEFAGTQHLFGLVIYPLVPDNRHEIWTTPALTNLSAFIATLSTLSADGSGIEPTYDVMFDLVNVSDPLGMGLRTDATPYIIVMTDEGPVSQNSVTEAMVAGRTTNCQIGNCQPGDKVEVFIITKAVYFPKYDTIVYGDTGRTVSITPTDENRYRQLLRGIFQNVCLY